MTDYRYSASPIIREFLNYHESIRNHSSETVDAYYFDLRCFIDWFNLRELHIQSMQAQQKLLQEQKQMDLLQQESSEESSADADLCSEPSSTSEETNDNLSQTSAAFLPPNSPAGAAPNLDKVSIVEEITVEETTDNASQKQMDILPPDYLADPDFWADDSSSVDEIVDSVDSDSDKKKKYVYLEDIDLQRIREIKTADIYEYLTWLKRDKNLSASSRARHLSSIKALFYYLTIATEQLDKNPTLSITPPKTRRSIPSYLSEEQVNILLDTTENDDAVFSLRDYTILLLFITCGLRVSEMAGLNLDRIHKDHIRIIGKGDKERIVYMSKETQRDVRDYLDLRYALKAMPGHESAAFLSNRKKRLSVRRIQSMVDERLTKAGLDASAFSPHKLRHTAATQFVKKGVDVRIIQEILGHEKLDTTQIYTHVDSADLREAAAAMSFESQTKNAEKNDQPLTPPSST